MREFAKHFVLESAILSTDRSVEVTEYDLLTLTDFEVFEELDLPYVTAVFTFTDTQNVMDRIDFQGSERLTITLSAGGVSKPSTPIKKTFVLDEVIGVKRLNEKMDQVFIHGIEDIDFESNVQNISKSFTGNSIKIVTQIANTYLNKEVLASDTDDQQMKVIVPNLDPIESMCWIKNRATNTDGLPFYLFSIFGDNNLRYYDLGSMLQQPAMNKDNPYVFSSNNAQQENPYSDIMTIKKFEYEGTENLYRIIRRGYIGSRNLFLNTATGTFKTINFQAEKDLFAPMYEQGYFPKGQDRFAFGPNTKVQDVNVSGYTSTVKSQIQSTGAYWGNGNYKTYNEEYNTDKHLQKIKSGALKTFLSKNVITIQVDGKPFAIGPDTANAENHNTIGRVVKILFYESAPDEDNIVKVDRKKSGDYLVFSTRHTFSINLYNVSLTCVKLSSLNEDGVQVQ
jgi:hypothetical protein